MPTDAIDAAAGPLTGRERHDAHERLQTRLADATDAVDIAAVDAIADAGGLRTEIVVPNDGIPPSVLEAVANLGLALEDVSHRTDAAVAVVR